MGEKIKTIQNYEFIYICRLIPESDSNGNLVRIKYELDSEREIHQYGGEEFCRFSIDQKWKKISGVYVLIQEGDIIYIGQASDFYKRFSQYGDIPEKGCYKGGRSTDCKINSMILKSYEEDKAIDLYFHETSRYDSVERALLANIPTKYNVAQNQRNKDQSQKKVIDYLEAVFREAVKLGKEEITLKSGDVHRDLKFVSAMPTVCQAMYKVMKSCDEIVSSTKSGLSSTIQIKYKLY